MKYENLIVENGSITLSSLYLMEDADDLMCFLAFCSKANCRVYFSNEDLTVEPHSDSTEKMKMSFLLNTYMVLKARPEIAHAYQRYEDEML